MVVARRTARSSGMSGEHEPAARTAAGPEDGVLLLALPAAATRLAVDDDDLASRLTRGAGERTEPDLADLEVTVGRHPVGRAPVSAMLVRPRPGGGSSNTLGRAGQRVAASAATASRAQSAAKQLRALGYDDVTVIRWDIGQAVDVPGATVAGDRLPARAGGRFARRALVIGRRAGAGRPTAYEAAVAAATAGVEGGPRHASELGPPLVKSGVLVALSDESVLRTALGPAAERLAGERRGLQLVHDAGAGSTVTTRVPHPLADGTAGIGVWDLQQRIAGTPATAPLAGAVLAQVLDVLAAIHAATSEPSRASGGPGAGADVVAAAAGDGDAVRDLARWAEGELVALPRTLAHGDLWHANLLVRGSSLSGIVDWDSAARHRPPLLDALHLVVSDRRRRGATSWGPGLLEHLLPWATSGDDPVLAPLGARLGIVLTPRQRLALLVTYWIDRAAYQLGGYTDRQQLAAWRRANVDNVTAALRSARGRG